MLLHIAVGGRFYFWFFVKFWGIQDFNIIDLDNT